MARKSRRREGVEAPTDLLPAETTILAIRRMRAVGLTWEQIGLMCGSDRRMLQRIGAAKQSWVTRGVAERVAHTDSAVAAHPNPKRMEAALVDADFTRWMVEALLARGWPSSWLGEQIGWTGTRLTPKDVRKARVRVEFEAKVRGVFDEFHHQWGPSRQTRLKMWRSGRFPADCYDWEDNDLRPIPGSLHPDLVVEATTFNRGARSRGEAAADRRATLAALAGWGQWPTRICARTSMRNWAEATGLGTADGNEDIPIHPGRSLWCGNMKHDHSLPAVWREPISQVPLPI